MPADRQHRSGGCLKQKYTIAQYEDLWQNDPRHYGCVSVQQAVDSLQMDAQAVRALIEKGVLECLEIGDEPAVQRMVTLKSLLLFKKAKTGRTADRPRRILEILTDAARHKKTLPYGEVMQSMGLSYQDALHRQIFKEDLRTAARQAGPYAQGLLISVLLVFRIQHIAEDDFFIMAQELGMFTPGRDSKTVFFKDQLERIFNYYAEN
jgi:hypothetical protein